jgi:transcriptional regulator with XRE-family HTH domain
MINRIKELREARGWSMAQLSARLTPPTDASQINKLEKGQRELTIAWMNRIAVALGCEPRDLIGYSVPLIGYIGPGAEVHGAEGRLIGGAPEIVEHPPVGGGALVALRVQGQTMYPRYENGDLIYYYNEPGVRETECLNRECVLKLRDGPTYLKKLLKGRHHHRYTLRSHNAPDIEEVDVEWASPVYWHKPA